MGAPLMIRALLHIAANHFGIYTRSDVMRVAEDAFKSGCQRGYLVRQAQEAEAREAQAERANGTHRIEPEHLTAQRENAQWQ
jgi:hypothetical protein